MTQTPWSHFYDSIVSQAEDLRFVGAVHPYSLPYVTSRLDVAHSSDRLPPSDQSLPHYRESNPPPQSTVGSELSDDISTDCRDLGFPPPPDIYDPWGSFRPLPNVFLNDTSGISPPTFHSSTSNSATQSAWSTGNNQIGFVDEFLPGAPPSDYLPTTAFLLHNSGTSSPHSNLISQPHGAALDGPYPCLWTEDGVVCHVMVQATRSQMNRHLHSYHRFGGSDTRQTRCHWAGCGETMQQGSIARHMVTCHLQAKVTCPTCSKKLSRQDVISKHQRVCPAASAWR